MGKRFAIVIGVAATGAMALGAQTALAAPVKYDTKLTITHEGHHMDGGVLWHGSVISKVRKCMEGRQVFLFKQRPGADRKLGTDQSQWEGAPSRREGSWGLVAPTRGRVYAKVMSIDRNVCRGDRSRTIENGRI